MATEEDRAYARQYRARNREKINAWKRAYYSRNREKMQVSKHQWTQHLRLEVLAHYAGRQLVCAHCGETDSRVLCLDHINGGGNQHRRELGKRSDSYWAWLKRNNYPNGFQVLCWNCNARKAYKEVL